MVIPDVNLLLHAYNTHSPQHATARSWWETTLNSPEQVGLAWVTILAFLRLTTKRTPFPRPMYAAEATKAVRSWLELPNVAVLSPGAEHSQILFGLVEQLGGGDLTTDTHLAALAMEYRAEIATTDTDFARFPGLRWFNPLARPHRRA